MKTTIELRDGRTMTAQDSAPNVDPEAWTVSLVDASFGVLEIEGAENGYDLGLEGVRRVVFEPEARR